MVNIMILRFGCNNFKSICEYQEVLMTAIHNKSEPQKHLLDIDGIRERVLPITAIYGANGAGKTNFISAIRFFINSVIFNASRDFSDIEVPKFKLDPDSAETETSFDIDFVLDGTHYHYGFSLDKKVVKNEWLYSFSYKTRMSRTVLFYRDAESDEEFYFSKAFKGKNKSISEITDKHSLFLSIAAKSKHEIAKEIYTYFSDNYNFRFRNSINEKQIGEKILDNNLEPEISKFLSLIDIGAVHLKVTAQEVDDEQKEMKENFKQALLSVITNKDAVELSLNDSDLDYSISISRKSNDGSLVKFGYSEESLGTKSLISLLASVFLILKNGGVFIVDELESSLHTLLSLKVVELFNCSKINSKGAQLIFTTHETQLLNFDGFRKDEVWLTEKCTNGSSKITSLAEYSIPKKSNIRKGYLDGRFGAIPFLGLLDVFENIWGAEDNEI